MAEAAMAKAAPAGRVDLAMELTQDLTTRFFGGYFGTPADDVTPFSDDARLLFQFMFADMANDPVFEQKVRPVAAAMRARVEKCIADRKGARGKHDDILERCLELQDIGTPGMDDDGIRNNMIGFIVGGLPQPPMIIPQLFDVLLDRPTELAGAQAAARAGDDDLVSRYVFEALRYYPLTPGLFRDTVADYEIAGGTMRSRIIPAGTRVMAATRSAMFDGRKVANPTKFRLDRPDYTYMNFGWGMHQCFGLYMNQQMIPAICKAVLKRPGLRRAPGPEGKLRLEGIFAMNLTVEFDG
jgi:cytochrome P450